MFSLLKRQNSAADLTSSQLFSDGNFYPTFQKDLQKCQRELIIESPFITQRRLATLSPILQKQEQGREGRCKYKRSVGV